MSSHVKCIISYGGEVVDRPHGVDYVGGLRKVITMDEGFTYDNLVTVISTRLGLKDNERVSKLLYRLPHLVEGDVRYMCVDVTDDSDVQLIVERFHGTPDMSYLELYVQTRRTRSRPRRNISSSQGGHEDDTHAHPPSLDVWNAIPGIDMGGDIEVPIATNDCQSVQSDGEDNEEDVHIAIEMGGSTELDQQRYGSSSQCDPPFNVPSAFKFSEMNVEVVSADWIGDHSIENYGGQNDELSLGMEFEDKQTVKNFVKQYSIKCNREFDVVESNTKSWMVHCRNVEAGCLWRVRASSRKKLAGGWEITRYNGPHTCISRTLSLDHRQMDSNFICHCIIEQVRNNPSMSISSIMIEIHNWLNFKPSYKKAWEAKQKAISQIWGDWDESYERLPNFFAAIKYFNPGSVVEWEFNDHTIETEKSVPCNEKILRRVFWSFKPVIDGLQFAKPILQIDGTFLYGKYKHTLLIATAVDGNNAVLPVAYALVERENKDSWGWFMALIRFHVVEVDGFCVISDRHGGILSTMANPYLGWDQTKAYHRFCLRHVASNFNTAIKNIGHKNLFIKAGTVHIV